MNGESMNVAAENNVPMTKQESKVTLANKKKTIAQSQRSVVIALDDYKKAAKKLQKKANLNAKMQAASAVPLQAERSASSAEQTGQSELTSSFSQRVSQMHSTGAFPDTPGTSPLS